jgi:hypothetical protein
MNEKNETPTDAASTSNQFRFHSWAAVAAVWFIDRD